MTSVKYAGNSVAAGRGHFASLDILRKARERIAQGWAQGQHALDSDGKYTTSGADNAASWCAIGALQSVAPLSMLDDEMAALYCALERDIRSPLSLAEWNDSLERTQEDVLRLYDCAIGRLQHERETNESEQQDSKSAQVDAQSAKAGGNM